jgi:dTDP-4-dehydrorhamnose 3,5-epimerase
LKLRATPIPGAFLIDLETVHDERGYFARAFCREELQAAGVAFEVAQSNIAWNRARGTLRGLHYQRPPHAESKVMRCTAGAAFVALVDLRRGSPSFGRPWTATLEAGAALELLVPEGVANGYQTLDDETELYYLMSTRYRADAAAGIRYDDPRLAIEWPLPVTTLSERDRALPPFDPETMAIGR